MAAWRFPIEPAPVSDEFECRLHGEVPYRCVLVHGGPGAAGGLRPVAERLSSSFGVVEHLQARPTVDGQIEGLAACVAAHSRGPIVLVGYSWGAWLALLAAARRPRLASKLILVSSGPLTSEFAHMTMKTRQSRMTDDERKDYQALVSVIEGDGPERNAALTELGTLIERIDSYRLLPVRAEHSVSVDARIFESVWTEASALRESGALLNGLSSVRCPITVMHGIDDPHPLDGVRIHVLQSSPSASIIVLEKCGHSPWRESFAHEAFHGLLHAEIGST